MSDDMPRDLKRLANAITERRMALGLTIAAVADAAAMSKDTYRRVEVGLPIRDSSYVKVDKALRWAPGSAIDISQGKEPIEVLGAAVPGVTLASIPDEKVKGAVTNAIVAVADGLTAREIREISARVLGELQKLIDADPS
jgi:hypothetical protein